MKTTLFGWENNVVLKVVSPYENHKNFSHEQNYKTTTTKYIFISNLF